jgi:hypothetical protein
LLVNREGQWVALTAHWGFLIYMTRGGNLIQGRKESVRQRFAAYKVKNFFNRYKECVKYVISLFLDIVNVCIIPQYTNT